MYEDIKIKFPEKELGKSEDLTNKRFGKWMALYKTENSSRGTRWVCKCLCEKETIRPVDAKSLLSGKSTSCGCERDKTISKNNDKKIHIRDENGVIVQKKCFRCNQWLPLSSFYKSNHHHDGYGSECKKCQNESKESRYNLYRKNATRRNIKFNLSKNDFYDITSKPCYYCGGYSNKDINNKLYNGVDRIDSSKDYDLSNVIPCCDICNKMKLDHSLSFFLEHINRIVKYTKEKNHG